MNVRPAIPVEPNPETRAFYVNALRKLDAAGVPFVVGGGYAMSHYTGIARNTKDLDIFVRPADSARTLEILAEAGYRTEYFYPFWIAKALHGDAFIDILYSSGNGVCRVDDAWFSNAEPIDVHGYATRLVPAEEQLWSKAFVQDRDRFDGADVAHLILCRGERFDWQRLLRRFDGHLPVLMAHVVLFDYAYPSERNCVPEWVRDHLHETVRQKPKTNGHRLCQGPFISQKGYLVDIQRWGYQDARLQPHGPLTAEEVAQLPSE